MTLRTARVRTAVVLAALAGRLPECFDDVPWNVPVPQAEYGND